MVATVYQKALNEAEEPILIMFFDKRFFMS